MQLRIRKNKERRIGIALDSRLAERLEGLKEDDFFTISKLIRKRLYQVLDGELELPEMYQKKDALDKSTFVMRVTPARYDQIVEFIEQNNYKSVSNLLRCIVADYTPDPKKKHYEFETD